MNDDTIDLEEMAKLLKCHPETVRELAAAGVIPAGKVGSSYVGIRSEILAWLSEFIKNQRAKNAEKLGAPELVNEALKPPRASLRRKTAKALPDLSQYGGIGTPG